MGESLGVHSVSARTMFEQAFRETEQLCLRDARDLRRYKPFVWGKICDMQGVTKMEWEDCVQIVMGIVHSGCVAFYRAQHEELLKYSNPESSDAPKKQSRAKLSTWLVGHVTKKYSSKMTEFFAQVRAFESGRVRIEREIDGKKEIGTLALTRYDVDGPGSPMADMLDERLDRRPDLMVMLNQFSSDHKGIIDMIVSLSEEDAGRREMVKCMHLEPIANKFGLSAIEFFNAVRGVFGHASALQNA